MLTLYIYKIKRFFKRKGTGMGNKGKKDKGKREEQNKGKHTVKEKRNQKKDKMKSVLANGR
jgi:hypothetical protein